MIHIKILPNNINRDSLKAWIPTIKKHNNRRAAKMRTAEGRAHRNSEDQNASVTAIEHHQSQQSIVSFIRFA